MTVDRWERRQLCEEGTCIGVIGAEGTCKTCGRPAPDWGDLRKPGRVSSQSDVDEPEVDGANEADAESNAAPTAPASPAKVAASASKVSAWNERRLCSDGTCIGLIADDGKCKVCRKAPDGTVDEKADDEDLEDEVAEGDDGEDSDDGEEDEHDEDDDDDSEVAQDEGDEGDADDGDVNYHDDAKDDAKDAAAEDAADDRAAAIKNAKNDDDDDRALCSDGTCIGLIADNGKCKVCGKAAA
ncbi:MAG: hypothetical protein H0V17_08780 [Deltaproteobacteria bacterium]|nr:hypothetical protein [Deltaproteobacteria bacterium]